MDAKTLKQRFSKPCVLDGGFATELENFHPIDFTGTDFWSAAAIWEHPELNVEVHKRFLAAGADINMTNTYKLVLAAMEHNGKTKEQGQKLAEQAVKHVRQAITETKNNGSVPKSRNILIAGCIGPYACALFKHMKEGKYEDYNDYGPYRGKYAERCEFQDMVDYHYEQGQMMANSGADFIVYETIPSLNEARACLAALDKLPDVYAWVALACQNGTQLNHGELFSETVEMCLKHPRVLAAGVNCSNPKYTAELLRSAQDSRKHGKPFIVYQNSGEEYDMLKGWHGTQQYKMTDWEHYVPEWYSLGATVIGGCCRVYSRDIQVIAECMEKLK